MLHDTFRELFTLTKNLSTAMQRRMLAIGLCIALISILIAACGTSTAAVQTNQHQRQHRYLSQRQVQRWLQRPSRH